MRKLFLTALIAIYGRLAEIYVFFMISHLERHSINRANACADDCPQIVISATLA